MEAYTGFALVYDTFMDNIPYEEWGKYLEELLHEYGVTGGIMLDIGCGTGTLTELMAKKGYDMIGIDYSEEMLDLALEKKEHSGEDILYLHQDMREFELYGTVNATISICDSINYITEDDELQKVFQLVNNYLDPKGIFIFDFNTVYKYKEVLGESTIAENREECSFIWDNYYYEDERMNEYELSLFLKEEDGRYRKFEETHYQKAYDLCDIKRLVTRSGLEYVTAYDAFTKNAPHDKSERIYVVVREAGKMKED